MSDVVRTLRTTLCVDTTASTDFDGRPIDALAEALFASDHREIDYGSDAFREATDRFGGDLGPLLSRRPDLIPLVRLLFELMDIDFRDAPISGTIRRLDQDDSAAGLADPMAGVSLGIDPRPGSTQVSLAAAADD